jgi:hypothetical protein
LIQRNRFSNRLPFSNGKHWDVCHKAVQYGNYAKQKKTKRCMASVVIIAEQGLDQIAEEASSDDLSLSPHSSSLDISITTYQSFGFQVS